MMSLGDVSPWMFFDFATSDVMTSDLPISGPGISLIGHVPREDGRVADFPACFLGIVRVFRTDAGNACERTVRARSPGGRDSTVSPVGRGVFA